MSTNKKVAITADSTCDLPKALVQKHNITVIPLSVLLGDSENLDGVDIMPGDIYDHVAGGGSLPKTSAVSPAGYSKVFGQLAADGYSIVHIGLSSAISSSYHNACVVAAGMDDVYCVDSKSLCTAMGLLVLEACDMAEHGMSAGEIARAVTEIVPKLSTTFVLDSLEYLHKGGRCSSVARFGANMLGLKPSIAVDPSTGKMDVAKKYRGRIDNVYKQYINDRLRDIDAIDPKRVVIANSGGIDSDTLAFVKGLVSGKNYFERIITADAGCTISSHCGPKTLALFYIKK